LFDVISEENNGLDIMKIVVASGSEKPYFLRKFAIKSMKQILWLFVMDVESLVSSN
jgi:hypothetical protein